jgi:outer membrane receptor for ferrienterochelin and colicins
VQIFCLSVIFAVLKTCFTLLPLLITIASNILREIRHNISLSRLLLMPGFFLTAIMLCCISSIHAQFNITVTIRNKADSSLLAGATIKWIGAKSTLIADSLGTIVLSVSNIGANTFVVTYAGYERKTFELNYGQDSGRQVTWWLAPVQTDEGEEEVIVTATRTSRTIGNTPTRMEVISGEELAEKGNMKPGDIRMLLSESTGIQTQQTSATSYNAGIRIQGLDGRYTQLLKDGFPMYAGFSGGLSILQIAPLDLKQVEVIKGSASTLYGGGAIAGLVNLVSKTPGERRELNFIANGTSAGGLDLSGFYSERYGKSGITVFASRNSTRAYDPADLGLTAIPESERYTLNPRLFLYSDKTSVDIGVSFITERRIGGNVAYIKKGTPGYFEKNNSDRLTPTLSVTRQVNEKSAVKLKSSYSIFDRAISTPGYQFEATQQASFTELTFGHKQKESEWIVGGNFVTDHLAEKHQMADQLRDYHYNVFGLFAQNTWSPIPAITIEGGLRADFVKQFGFEWLPRVSGLFKLSSKISTRLGGGFGYKTPTVFTEESERIQFRNILPLNAAIVNNERSVGGNWDVNYRTNIGELNLSINHMFFYTRLNQPLVLQTAAANKYEFVNAGGYLDTRGTETNVRVIYSNFKLFIGYTYTDANTHYAAGKISFPLTAKHRLNNVLMYEIEEKLKLGLEAYYFSGQVLSDGQPGRPYWIMGFMAEKLWERFSIFINFENFTDSRQTRWDTIYTGSIDSPVFRDIYAPVDGFVINGGLKIWL